MSERFESWPAQPPPEKSSSIPSAENASNENSPERASAIVESMWPEVFNIELRDWKMAIEAKATDKNSVAPLLLNKLHNFNILLHSPNESDRENLDKATGDLSRYAYRFWKETGMNEQQCQATAEKWMPPFESLLKSNNYALRVVRVGQAKDDSWMTYRPDGKPVKEVRSWAVTNTKLGGTTYKAVVS